MVKYVTLANEFYKFTYFDSSVMRDMTLITDETICKQKLILATLWMNATYDDFKKTVQFLEKRIGFLEQGLDFEIKEMGYSSIFRSSLCLQKKKSDINYETPYHLSIYLRDEENNTYYLPNIRYGIYNDEVYIFALQSVEQEKNDYSKKINRLLYKTGEGFDSLKDNSEIYDIGNLKDVTASFLVAANIAVSYFHSLGYRKIIIPSFLVSRWNSFAYAVHSVSILGFKKGKYFKEKEQIQKNITDKFIRTFLRLAYHNSGIRIDSYPMDNDDCLHVRLGEELNANNRLLQESDNIIRKKLVK